jgi:hypothetical protein
MTIVVPLEGFAVEAAPVRQPMACVALMGPMQIRGGSAAKEAGRVMLDLNVSFSLLAVFKLSV